MRPRSVHSRQRRSADAALLGEALAEVCMNSIPTRLRHMSPDFSGIDPSTPPPKSLPLGYPKIFFRFSALAYCAIYSQWLYR